MTPLPTKVALVATLATTLVALGVVLGDRRSGALHPAGLAPILWLLTVLFALRVAGQVLVALRAPWWLPPMDDWHLLPYRLLLPVQLAFLGVMAWISFSFSTESGLPVERSRALGRFLIFFALVYAGSMVVRYAVRMRRRPQARWFGGTIPITFHLVLATYLYALGAYHVGS